jgi:hypothetical protein
MLGWSTGILVTVIGALYGRFFPAARLDPEGPEPGTRVS